MNEAVTSATQADDSTIKGTFHDAEDLDDPFVKPTIDPAVFRSPVVTRGAVASVAVLILALWPGASGRLLAPIAAIGLAGTGVLTLWSARRTSGSRRVIEFLYGLALIGAAVLFVVAAKSPVNALVRLMALVLLLTALRSLALWRAQLSSSMSVASAIGATVIAALMWTFPESLFKLGLAAIGFVNLGLLFIAVIELSHMPPEKRAGANSMTVTYQWFRSRAVPKTLRDELYEKVIFEGSDATVRLARFYTLMGFAAVIATMGVITDSTAVVIGAMLIAPLMTPLMGIAASLAMGWPHRLQRMAIVAASGMVWAILIGVLLGAMLSSFIDLETNTQIQSRITPTLLDLITATAAGAAGAYGLSRSDVSDSLPGVAIAISLVPPLSVVGVCWSVGGLQQGTGALLLFLTNAVAIMLVGAFTFLVTGMAPVGRATVTKDRVRNAAIAILALGSVVLAGLLINGRQLTTQQLQEGTVRQTVNDWLQQDRIDGVEGLVIGGGYTIAKLDLDDPFLMRVDLIGPRNQQLPSASALAVLLSKNLHRDVSVELRVARYDVGFGDSIFGQTAGTDIDQASASTAPSGTATTAPPTSGMPPAATTSPTSSSGAPPTTRADLDSQGVFEDLSPDDTIYEAQERANRVAARYVEERQRRALVGFLGVMFIIGAFAAIVIHYFLPRYRWLAFGVVVVLLLIASLYYQTSMNSDQPTPIQSGAPATHGP